MADAIKDSSELTDSELESVSGGVNTPAAEKEINAEDKRRQQEHDTHSSESPLSPESPLADLEKIFGSPSSGNLHNTPSPTYGNKTKTST